MTSPYGSIRAKLATQKRFDQFVFELQAAKKKRISHDDALSELLKRAGY